MAVSRPGQVPGVCRELGPERDGADLEAELRLAVEDARRQGAVLNQAR